MTTSLTVSLFIAPSDPVNLLTLMQLCSSEIPFDKAEWEKVWIRLSAHLQPFFLAHRAYFNNFRQKIPYFDVSRQKRVLFNCFATKQCLGMLKCEASLFFALSESYWISPCLSLALYGSL